MKKSMNVFFHSLKGRLSGGQNALLPTGAAPRPFRFVRKAGEVG